MLAKKRIDQITNYLKEYKSATVTELSEKFNVTEVTIRKDLSVLESNQLIERVFGGALWIEQSISNEISYDIKKISRVAEKTKIAKEIIKEISDNDSIFLDAGSTNNILAGYLDQFTNLTILTNDLLIALKLSELAKFRIIFIGGEVSNLSKATADYNAVQNLSTFNVDLSILGCDSFSINGACTTSVNKAGLKLAAISNSNKRILSTTGDKYSKNGLVRFAELQDFDKIYTDKSIQDVSELNELENVIIEFC